MSRVQKSQGPGFRRAVWLFPLAFAEVAATVIGGAIHTTAVAQQVYRFRN